MNTRPYIMRKLRELSRVKGKQRTWISECSDQELYEIFLRLRNEESAKSIAQYIRKAWRLSTQGNVHALSQGILKYQKRIHDLLQASLIPEKTDQNEQGMVSETEKYDDLLGLERLVRLQRERVERMMKEEKEVGVKHSNLSRDLQSLAALTKVLVKEKEFAIKHAIDPVKEREGKIRARRIDDNFNSFLANTTQKGRQTMVDVMDRFLQAVAENTIPVFVTTDENGNVQYKPENNEGDREI